jgi:chromosome segregation ATPase
MTEPTAYYRPEPSNSNVKTALVGGALAALLVSNVYLFIQIHDMKADAAKSRDSIEAEVENLKENSSQVVATNRKHLENLKDDLENARRQANLAASQAKKESLTYTEQQAKRLEQQQEATTQKVTGQISEVKDAANTANAKIENVNGEVTNVKSLVATNKNELDKTILDLKKVTGDLGVTSGYVATNGKELDALKRLGERTYVEFKLAKGKQPQRIGEVSMILKKADPKHNRFTFELTADDKTTEKKDRTINEPIQFLMARAKQPYEIIVNSVQKDLIVGYLAEPKVQTAR